MKQETVSIETAEKIRFDYRIAQTGTRIGAYIMDMAIQGLILILVILLLVFIGLLHGNWFSMNKIGEVQAFALAFFLLLIFFFQWGYFTLFEMFKNGQSPGKRAMRISVIRSNGDPVDASVIILRNLLRAVDGFPGGTNLVGGLICLLDKKTRRLGDLVADTVVVHDIRFDLQEPSFQTNVSKKSMEEQSLKLMSKLNEEELYVIRRFLSDHHLLSPERQQELAAKLSANVKKRLNITETFTDNIVFLERIYTEHSVDPDGKKRNKG